MKRTHLTKFAAVFTALLILSVSAGLPVLAGSLTLCTAEADGEPPFEILAANSGAGSGTGGTAGGSGAGTGGTSGGSGIGGALEGAAEDIGNAVDDLIPGNDSGSGNSSSGNTAGGDSSSGNTAGGDSSSGNQTSGQDMTGSRDENAGNGNLEEGQAGGDENGVVGDGTGRDTTNPDSGTSGAGTSDTGRNPTTADENTTGAGTGTETTAQDDGGTNWASIIVALLIAVALVVVIVALLPRKRTD